MSAEFTGFASSAGVQVPRRRMLVWRQNTVRPFVWHGLWPLLGWLALLGYALWPFAQGEVEATVRRSVQAKLAARGLADVRADVSGQWVHLSGPLPAGVEQSDVVNAARKAMCATWLGDQPCALLVTAALQPSASAPMAPAALTTTPATTPATAPAPPPTRRASAPVPDACERALTAAMARSRIEFGVASPLLLARSAPVLDEVAAAVSGCRGVINIEGHTDAQGDPERNDALSLARAEAVHAALVARGVPAARLRAQGLGSMKPLADNDSEEGRRRNRRIEFKLLGAR